MAAIREVLKNEHEDPGQVTSASDTDVDDGDSSDESFDYDYSDGDPVSEPDEEGLSERPSCMRWPRRFVARTST